jgi:hypothetical protein
MASRAKDDYRGRGDHHWRLSKMSEEDGASRTRQLHSEFFDISKDRIAADILTSVDRHDELAQSLKSASQRQASGVALPPSEEAEHWHEMLIWGHALLGRLVPDDFVAFLVVHQVEEVADGACETAFAGGVIAELASRLREIEEREGLGPDEEFARIGEGPPDHVAAASELNDQLRRIHDTVLSVLLRRYQFQELADLFENDRAEYAVRREVGRRLAHGDSTAGLMESQLMNEFGAAAIERLHQRLKQAGMFPRFP